MLKILLCYLVKRMEQKLNFSQMGANNSKFLGNSFIYAFALSRDLRHIWPSSYLYEAARLPLDLFARNLVLCTIKKPCREFPTLDKIGPNIGLITWRPKYVYIVDSNIKCFAARKECQGNQRLHLRSNTHLFYTVCSGYI